MSIRIVCAFLWMSVLTSALNAQNFSVAPADSQAIRDLIALHADASQHGDFDRLVAG